MDVNEWVVLGAAVFAAITYAWDRRVSRRATARSAEIQDLEDAWTTITKVASEGPTAMDSRENQEAVVRLIRNLQLNGAAEVRKAVVNLRNQLAVDPAEFAELSARLAAGESLDRRVDWEEPLQVIRMRYRKLNHLRPAAEEFHRISYPSVGRTPPPRSELGAPKPIGLAGSWDPIQIPLDISPDSLLFEDLLDSMSDEALGSFILDLTFALNDTRHPIDGPQRASLSRALLEARDLQRVRQARADD